MRARVLGILLAGVVGSVAQAGSFFLASASKEELVAIDLETLQRSGDAVTFWSTTFYPIAQSKGRDRYDEMLTKARMDCRADMVTNLYVVTYALGSNTPVESGDMHVDSLPIIPESVAALAKAGVCAQPLPVEDGTGKVFVGTREQLMTVYRKLIVEGKVK